MKYTETSLMEMFLFLDFCLMSLLVDNCRSTKRLIPTQHEAFAKSITPSN